ncbi:GreA/GreB family elongation factor [Chelatococcus asaccharovorans]|uniref:GreA/GreB family elongation factor n=1 Tax=Chelatococcus asaccharovorans TaxID=28210 RepID=UPI002263B74A|nr:GreA/GreB family elongation factor [Chelatococcus asaccharovorans]
MRDFGHSSSSADRPSAAMNLIHALPPIALGADDFHRLAWLAEAAKPRLPRIAGFLHRELARATLVEPWFGLVTMGSMVRFLERGCPEERVGKLVYPADVPRHEKPISILSETGAALIGLCEGQTLHWRAAGGQLQSVTVIRSD